MRKQRIMVITRAMTQRISRLRRSSMCSPTLILSTSDRGIGHSTPVLPSAALAAVGLGGLSGTEHGLHGRFGPGAGFQQGGHVAGHEARLAAGGVRAGVAVRAHLLAPGHLVKPA